MLAFLRRLWELMRPFRARFTLGVVTGIISALLEPAMIAVVTFVYEVIFQMSAVSKADTNVGKLPGWLAHIRDWLFELKGSVQESLSGVANNPKAVILLVSAIPAVMLLRGLFGYLNGYSMHWVSVRAVTNLRTRLFEHLLNSSAGFFHKSNSGELMSRVMNDTTALQQILYSNATIIIKEPATLIFLMGYLFWQQPMLTFLALIILPVCVVPISIYNRKSRHAGRGMQEQLAELGSVMSESFTGIRVIKAYNLESTAVGQFRAAAGRFVSHYMKIVRSLETPGPMLEFVGAIGIAIVLAYVALGPFENRPTSADFLRTVMAMFMMYRPIKTITRLYNNLEQARASTERAFELLDAPSGLVEPANPKPIKAAGAEIQFDNVTFNYGEKPVLSGVNLTIKPGQMVALVGQTGSGKTSLTSLLLRFYDPQQGAVRIGGVDIREAGSRDLRSQIAVVTQETILFNDTIRNNIAMGRPGATEAEIIAAAKHASAEAFIAEKEKGFETQVGEKGAMLSGGQRQRIAIARAILKDAPILILDEATSALDSETERAVQGALEKLMQGRTTIVIAHRLSTIQNADVIVAFDQGRIVEAGTHAELIRRGGVYQKLHALQFQGGKG